jgi:hypothetical protein
MSARISVLFVTTVLAAAVGFSAEAAGKCSWLRWAPEAAAPEEWVKLPSGDIYEVAVSMHDSARRELASAIAVPLTVERAKQFNDRYESVPGKQPYLVRAVYGHAETGGYGVVRRGNDVRVYHSSLGRTSLCKESALVVNLDFVPREVYVEVFIAE